MQGIDEINGSPHDEACSNIDSHGTTNSSLSSRVIRPATSERDVGTVPLFLIPRVVATEITRDSQAILEIHIIRARGHCYAITFIRTVQEAVNHG